MRLINTTLLLIAFLGSNTFINAQDVDGDGYTIAQGDCNDNNPTMHPGATDVCGDGIDQDCDGADLSCGGVDADNDGVTINQGDCNDMDDSVYPGATEICGDGVDQDCNGTDLICGGIDIDGDGYTTALGDCNDNDPNIYPGALEICDDGIDQDCNGVDLSCAGDNDGDTFTVAQGDCNDLDHTVYPGAPELCDGKDNDCNGVVDDGFLDTDSDGIADCIDSDADGDGFTLVAGDCNDLDPTIHPGAAELCDGLDNNCNGIVDESPGICGVGYVCLNGACVTGVAYYQDQDGDGFGNPSVLIIAAIAPLNYVADNTDCYDMDPTVYPGAIEICGDGIDQDCDGADLVCSGLDSDNDGIVDTDEINWGMDPNDPDSDGDGIYDGIEFGNTSIPLDTDFDGLIDPLDTDDDDDGLQTSVEYLDEQIHGIDVDGDGVSNHLDSDSDNDGVIDGVDGVTDNDGDGIPDYLDINNLSCSSSYELSNVSATCSSPTFCVPLVATTAITSGLMGVDYTLDYDPAVMTPTGNVALGSVATGFGASAINTSISGKVIVTVYLNGAPAGTFLNGAGEIACVEFTVNAGVTGGTTSTISVDGSVLEGIAGNPTCPATPSTFTFEDDNMLSGFVRYRNKNGRPLLYDAGNPNTYIITDIIGVDGSCAAPASSIAPDLNGDFTYDNTNGTLLQFERDIIGDFSVPNINCGNVMAVINATDRNQTLNIITLTNPTPTVYQLLSADVNLDGIVSSQDASMITSRTINDNYCEFNQGNYVWDSGSTSYIPTATYSKSKDWLFIDATTLNSAAFTAGMGKNNVPQVPNCLPINMVNNGTCNTIPAEDYEAILLGDVNGNWNTVNAADAKSGEAFTVVFDLDNATVNGAGNYEVPVSYIANTGVTAVDGIDFSMDFDGTSVNVINTTIDAGLPTMQNQWQNHSNELLMFTAFDNNTISTTGTVVSIEIQSNSGALNVQDLGEIIAYVNGDPAGVEIRGINIATGLESSEESSMNITVYPNPNNGDQLFVSSNNETTIEQVIVTSVTGKEMLNRTFNKSKSAIEMPLQNIAKGVYFVTIVTDNNRKIEKLIVN